MIDRHAPNPLGEQLFMAYRDVSRFEDSVELSDGHQAKIDHLLNEYRGRHAVIPVEPDGHGGVHTAGNPDARWLSYRGSPDLPKYNPDDPQHTAVPMVIPAWNLDHEWAVRGSSIEDVIGGFAIKVTVTRYCDWHFAASKAGGQPPGVLVRAQGQIILLLYVCGNCRDRLDKTYNGGLLFLELAEVENSGIYKVQIPTTKD